ncbi:hypothetical protein LZ31DRAFT_358482 [Colletotrichum somersetense]|nr:hypothetical protein LZ31DRAFT_358482 [Colletotrichum somersetense]
MPCLSSCPLVLPSCPPSLLADSTASVESSGLGRSPFEMTHFSCHVCFFAAKLAQPHPPRFWLFPVRVVDDDRSAHPHQFSSNFKLPPNLISCPTLFFSVRLFVHR